MGQHRLDLGLVEPAQQARGGAHHRRLGAAAGGERVRHVGLGDGHPRLGHVGQRAQTIDHAVQLGRLSRVTSLACMANMAILSLK